MGGVSLLPEELRSTEEKAGTHFPTHHVGPLVDEERQVAITLNPAGESGTDDRLGSRTDHVGLGEFTGRNHFPILKLEAVMSDDSTFGREALNMSGFFFEIAHRNEQGEVGVLVSRVLEPLVELALDLLPEPVTPWLDNHAAAHFRIFGKICGADDLLIPFGKVFIPGGCDRVFLSFGHGDE